MPYSGAWVVSNTIIRQERPPIPAQSITVIVSYRGLLAGVRVVVRLVGNGCLMNRGRLLSF